MNAEQINRRFDEIARCLRTEDPELLRRVERVRRREVAHVALVLGLLTAAAVLLTWGVAVLSPLVWCAGVAAFVGAFVADQLLHLS